MIIDSLANASKYYSSHPQFKAAFDWVLNTNLYQLPDGTDSITDYNLKAIASNKMGKTAAESLEKFECHNKHIDIQVCISGQEQIAWKPRHSCTHPKGEYNPDKDVLFYADEPDMFFQLKDSQFVIFFPEDVHAPMIGNNQIKKLVIKVPVV